jgi:hypothetical protein
MKVYNPAPTFRTALRLARIFRVPHEMATDWSPGILPAFRGRTREADTMPVRRLRGYDRLGLGRLPEWLRDLLRQVQPSTGL